MFHSSHHITRCTIEASHILIFENIPALILVGVVSKVFMKKTITNITPHICLFPIFSIMHAKRKRSETVPPVIHIRQHIFVRLRNLLLRYKYRHPFSSHIWNRRKRHWDDHECDIFTSIPSLVGEYIVP